MSGEVVRALRISLVGMRVHPDLVGTRLPAHPPLAALATPNVYVKAVDAARQRDGGVELPWPPPRPGDTRPNAQHFWYLYLGGRNPDNVASVDLWKNLVPLRTRTGVAVGGTAGMRVRAEAFHWGHATGLVVTLDIADPIGMSLQSAAQAAVTARHAAAYTLDAEQGMPLDAVVDALVQRCASETRGVQNASQRGVFDRFTVTTVIDGEADAAAVVDTEVQRALQACAKWSEDWKVDALAPLDNGTVLKSRSPRPPGHVLYGTARSRVVWYPTLFSSAERHHRLGCLHRNLTLLTIQTGALLDLIAIADTAGDNSPLRTQMQQRSAGLLGRLYGPGTAVPVNDMYQSWSARRQVDDSGLGVAIDRARALFSMPPLARPGAAPEATPPHP